MLLLQTGELEREIVKGRGSHVGAKFEGNLFVNTYNSITKDLEQIKSDNHVAFHVIMSTLHNLVV